MVTIFCSPQRYSRFAIATISNSRHSRESGNPGCLGRQDGTTRATCPHRGMTMNGASRLMTLNIHDGNYERGT
jgi:hypothetical protein